VLLLMLSSPPAPPSATASLRRGGRQVAQLFRGQGIGLVLHRACSLQVRSLHPPFADLPSPRAKRDVWGSCSQLSHAIACCCTARHHWLPCAASKSHHGKCAGRVRPRASSKSLCFWKSARRQQHLPKASQQSSPRWHQLHQLTPRHLRRSSPRYFCLHPHISFQTLSVSSGHLTSCNVSQAQTMR